MNAQLKPYIVKAKIKYSSSESYRIRSDYYDAFNKYDIEDKTILYEAYYGRGITCNPGGLFRYLLNDERFADYTHIWVLEKGDFRSLITSEFKSNSRVKFVEPFTKEYFMYLSKAKYLINNVTWQNYFIKKEGQVVINTWHGIPLKSLGYDVPDGNRVISNIIRNLLFTDFLISPVAFTTDNFKNSFKLDGIFPGKIIEAGYPRIDATVNADKKEAAKQLQKFGVSYDPSKKLILYAPTWRGAKYGSADIDIDEYDNFIDTVYKHIDKNEYQVLFKPHQLVYKTLAEKGMLRDNFIPATADTNAVLGITDILVSDYSSIFFDFLVTGRPIIFYVPDFEKYKQERGLYFSVEDLPGPVSAELDEVAYWISNIDKYDTFFDAQKYTDAVKKYVYNDDGNACKRVVDAVFFGDESNTVSLKNNKKRLLFHTDALNTNGITFSLLNLLNNIDYEKYDVSLYAIEPKSGLSILDCVNPKARVLYRNSAAVANPKTEARREYCHENAIVASDNSPLFPKEFYELEYRRCFGDAQFDCIINFSGYNGFWANVYAANNSNAKNIIWMHSDLVSEFEKVVNGKRIHEKNLAQIFKIYDSVDKIVGCSNTTMLENRKNLATDKTYDKFTSAENLIDIDRIISGADKENIVKFNDTDFIFEACVNENGNTEYTLFPIPQKDKINFVTMGRLFPEKNHENLIKAFARINNEHPETALYIIGDGPLRAPLRRLIENLKLDKKVFLTGNMSNPFALLKRCSCFILPSYHEGLPMVLLEARTLGLPIIVSDFTTVADSIYENGQLVIGMEEEDIYNGLKAFINGEVLNEFKFDPKQYNNEAMAQFEMCL